MKLVSKKALFAILQIISNPKYLKFYFELGWIPDKHKVVTRYLLSNGSHK